jgi:hypothetical protein
MVRKQLNLRKFLFFKELFCNVFGPIDNSDDMFYFLRTLSVSIPLWGMFMYLQFQIILEPFLWKKSNSSKVFDDDSQER